MFHPNTRPQTLQSVEADYDLWHQWFGHAGRNTIRQLPNHVNGAPNSLSSAPKSNPCAGCALGKSHRQPFPLSSTRASKPLELIHSDLVEMPSLSIDGFKYCVTFLDDFSSFGVMYYLKRKSDALTCFKSY